MGLLQKVKSQSAAKGNYPYATTRVRAKKAKLLPKDAYQKLLKLSIPEITSMIGDTVYQEQVDELASRFSGVDLLESALNVNEEHTYAQVRHFTTGEGRTLVSAFLDRYNYRDIKVIMRGKHYGATQEEMLKELLIEDREEFEFLRALMADDVQGVQGVVDALRDLGARGRMFHDALLTAQQQESEPTLAQYEDALERGYYSTLLATVRPETPAKRLFRRYIEHEIDFVNLLAVLRYRRAKVTWEGIEGIVIQGGLELNDAALRRILEAPSLDDVANELHTTKFGTNLDQALAGGSLAAVEIAARKHLMEFASGFSHMNPLSILPILDYLLRKHNEVRNIRAVARGKESGLSEETIENMLII